MCWVSSFSVFLNPLYCFDFAVISRTEENKTNKTDGCIVVVVRNQLGV